MARTPIHPGEILADELEEIGISAAELARTLAVPARFFASAGKSFRTLSRRSTASSSAS